jgi:hypothetical protein
MFFVQSKKGENIIDLCVKKTNRLRIPLPEPAFITNPYPIEAIARLQLKSCPRNSMSFAAGQSAVFQGASDEHI